MKFFYKNIFIQIFFSLSFLFIGIIYLTITYPFEDALILYRYSNNLSEFFEIAFNKGDRPVEGATDFLWMIILACLSFIKIDPVFGSLIINSISLYIILNIILKKILFSNNFIYNILIALLFINIGSIINPSIGGFSILTFCALGLLVYNYAIELKLYKWSIVSIIFCLFRPEAVIFFVFSIPIILKKLNKNQIKSFIYYILFIIFIGLAYNLFRIIYFEDILPITLQIKSIGSEFSIKRIFAVISQIFSTFFLSMLIFVIFGIIIAAKNKIITSYEILIFFCINIALFIYLLLLSNSYLSQNIYYRYFSHFNFIYFIFTIYIFTKIKYYKKLTFILTIILLFGSYDQSNLLQRQLKITNQNISTTTYEFIIDFQNERHARTLVAISQSLKNLPKNIKLMITEAGHLPYISKKYSIDMAGLNTYKFSKRPVNCNDFKDYSPDIVEFDVGLLDYFKYNKLQEDKTIPACGILSKNNFYNKDQIFNFNKIKLISSYNHYKIDKHRNATVVVAPNNALYCLKNNNDFNLIFINKFSDQIYFIKNNKDLKETMLDSCNYQSKGYLFDNYFK